MYPYLFHSGNLYLPTFGVLAALGLMLALALSQRTARLIGLDPEAVWNAGLFAVIAAFILSRVLLIATNFHSFLQFPILLLRVPSLTATGLLITFLATLLWMRLHRLPTLRVLDAWAPCATLTWAFLALGHFAEGSDPGLPARFGLRMPGESTPLHPVALYVAAYALLLTIVLFRWLSQRHTGALALALIGAGTGEFLFGFLRQPDLFGITTLLDPLQWVAMGMVIAGGVVYVITSPASRYETERVSHAL